MTHLPNGGHIESFQLLSTKISVFISSMSTLCRKLFDAGTKLCRRCGDIEMVLVSLEDSGGVDGIASTGTISAECIMRVIGTGVAGGDVIAAEYD